MAGFEDSSWNSASAKQIRARWVDAVRKDSQVRGSTLEVALCLIFDFANHRTLECFPYLETVAAKVGINKRTVQRATRRLSELGYLKTRIRGRGRSRAYEFCFPQASRSSKKGDNAVTLSHSGEGQMGDMRGTLSVERATDLSRKGDRDVASNREPESKNLKVAAEPAHASGRSGKEFVIESQGMASVNEPSHFEEFWRAYPRKVNREAAEVEFQKALEGGVEPQRVLTAVRAYAAEQNGNSQKYIAHPENWLAKRRWETYAPSSPVPTRMQILEHRAQRIREGKEKPYLVRSMLQSDAYECVEAELITVEECRAAGVLY